MLRFGTFELDTEAGELRRHGALVRLQPQPFKVLVLLAGRAGEVVSREEIRRALWGDDTFVEFDQGLGYCLTQIRQALGDDFHAPRYVETLPRRGYRFVAPVRTDGGRDAGASGRTSDGPWLRRLARPWGLALLLLGLLVAIERPGGGGAKDEGLSVRLVVLPFEDLGGEPANGPLADALTEEMIAEIGRLNPRRLRVIARSTAMRYRDSPPDLGRLRSELDVDYVLEGSVRFDRDRVRVTARLVRVEDLAQVWVDSYDREMRDLLALERQVAADAARQIRVALTPEARRRVGTARPTDPEVHRLTLVASHHTALRTPESLESAVSLFEEAVERDPGHAPAWAGLSEALLALGDRNLRPAAPAFDAAEDAARRAVALDPGLGDAHAAMGGVAACRDWRWDEARASYDRALALDPADSRVLRWYSHLLMTLDQREAALDYAYRATQVDPLSVLAHHELTCALLLAGRPAEALEQARRAEQLDLSGKEGPIKLAAVLLALGRAEEALSALDDRSAPPESSTEIALARARALEALGRPDEARAALVAVLRSIDQPSGVHGSQGVAPSVLFDRARALAALGERERALDALERSIAEREPAARWLAVVDEFAGLRDEPRFQALRRSLGIV